MTKQVCGTNCPTILWYILPIAVVLLVFALIFVAPAAASAEKAPEIGAVTAVNATQLKEKLGNNVTLVDKHTISLNNDINLTGQMTLQLNEDVTIIGNGHTIWRGGEGFFLIDITSQLGEHTVTLGDGKTSLTIDGQNKTFCSSKNCYGLIAVVGDGARLIMNEKVTLTHSDVSNGSNDKTIEDNRRGVVGAAVQVVTNAEFIMYGGEISHNKASRLGSVYVNNNAKFIMYDGQISDNVVTKSGSEGGAIFNGAEVSLHGGKIIRNTALGTGGGIHQMGVLTITGGIIAENKAPAGGGVHYQWSGEHTKLIVSGNPYIYGNVDNNNLRLRGPMKITIGGPLDDTAKIGVMQTGDGDSAATLTYNNPVPLTVTYTDNTYNKYANTIFIWDAGRAYFEPIADETGTRLYSAFKIYSIIQDIGQGGTLIIKETARCTEPVTMAVVPNPGYEVDSVSIIGKDGTPIATGTSFTMPNQDVTVKATFTPLSYTVTTGSMPHGIMTTLTKHVNDEVQILIDAEDGYRVVGIAAKTESGEDVAVNGDIFKMPADNVIVSATFEKISYEISVPVGSGISVDRTTAYVGDSITVTPTDSTKTIEKVTITPATTKTPMDAGTTFAMPADNIEVTATFVIGSDKKAIKIIQVNGGTISTNVSYAANGDKVKITATPAEGYKLVDNSLTVTGTASYSLDADNIFTMQNEDVTITAAFSNSYNVVAGTSVNGAVTVKSTLPAAYNSEVTVEATPATGYEFAYITITNTGDSTSFTVIDTKFKMPAYDVAVTAEFEPKLYTIELRTENGTITASQPSAMKGTSVTFLATPKAGYEFVQFNITNKATGTSDKNTGNPYTYTIDNDTLVTFEVKPVYYTIALDEQKATISLTPNKYTATMDTPITVTATAESGYVVNQIQVLKEDGSIHAAISGTSGSFIMPAFDIIIKAVETTASSSSSSSSSGSSIWLMETQTPTETPTPTQTPTDTVPTEFPTTQPTDVKTPGFGVLAVLAGLGAVAVLRRR